MIPLDSLTFGTDAEFFLKTLNGSPFPVCGMVGGTKEAPLPIESLGKGYALQEDNAALEFNVPATNSANKLWRSTRAVLNYVVKSKLPKGLIIDFENCSAVFDEKYLQIPEMQVFGCEPDFNAYLMQANDRPMPPVPGFRSAAAHVHLGWSNPDDDDRVEIIRLADVFVSCPNLLSEKAGDAERRQLYGKAGAFRFKPYGVEHRVLSNSWLSGLGTIQETIFHYVKAVCALNAGMKVEPKDYSRIMTAINSADKEAGLSIYKQYDAAFTKLIGPHFNFKSLVHLFE